MARICPDCQVELQPKTFRDVEADVCPKCSGIFFDDDEITRLKAIGGDSFSQFEGQFSPVVAGGQADARRLCPGCGHAMNPYKYLYKSPVTLDACSNCGGIWVQHGELAQMQEYALRAVQVDPNETKAAAISEMEGSLGGDVQRAHGIERFFQWLAHPMPPYFGFSDDILKDA